MTDRECMTEALRLARLSGEEGEVPVGAVIAKDGIIIASGRNMREQKKNALSHAETEAINAACRELGSWRLTGCVLYVTLEPCPMCAGACINARLDRVVFGAYDYKAGSFDSVTDLNRMGYNHKPEITAGFMERECSAVLTEFFASLRKK